MRPITRLEMYLAALANDEDAVSLPAPITRVEMYLAKIAGETVTLPETPITRVEMYLAKIAGEDVEIPDRPITRDEMYLAAIAGEDNEVPEPITRIEMYLARWAEESAEVITTVTGVSPLTLANALAKPLRSLVQYGKCVQDGTPTPSAPVDIVCNNGALRMLNLANMAESNLDIGYYLNNSGVRTQSPLNFYTLGFIPVKPSATYTMKTSASLNYFSIMEYDSAQGFLNRTLWGSSSSPAGDTVTFTTRSDTAYLRFGSNMNGYTLTYADIAAVTWMLTEGATAQDYVPYGQLSVVGTPEVLTVSADGAATQTVTNLPMLLSVGNFKDELDIVSGIKTGKIGIKVFDGTENFGKSSAYGAAFYIQSAASAWGAQKEIVMCSHYLGLAVASSASAEGTCFFNASRHFCFRVADNSDTAAFKAWLAAQYAAGTPVIVLSPLAEEITEQTTPHSLHSYEGTTIVEADTNVDPVTLSAEYAASEEDET